MGLAAASTRPGRRASSTAASSSPLIYARPRPDGVRSGASSRQISGGSVLFAFAAFSTSEGGAQVAAVLWLPGRGRGRRSHCRPPSWPLMYWITPPVKPGKPMPKMEPMLASATELSTPREALTVSGPRRRHALARIFERDRIAAARLELLAQTRPQQTALTVGVVVAGAVLYGTRDRSRPFQSTTAYDRCDRWDRRPQPRRLVSVRILSASSARPAEAAGRITRLRTGSAR